MIREASGDGDLRGLRAEVAEERNGLAGPPVLGDKAKVVSSWTYAAIRSVLFFSTDALTPPSIIFHRMLEACEFWVISCSIMIPKNGSTGHRPLGIVDLF